MTEKNLNPRSLALESMHLPVAAATAAKSLQSCPTLCDPRDSSPPGYLVPEILQARILEWVAISFSNAWKWKVKVKSLSHARLLATPWTAAYQAPPSMGLSRQECWSGLPLPSPTGAMGRVYYLSEIHSLTGGRGGMWVEILWETLCYFSPLPFLLSPIDSLWWDTLSS